MILRDAVAVAVRPVRTLRDVTAAPPRRAGPALVACTGIAAALLQVLSAFLEPYAAGDAPDQHRAAIVLDCTLPIVFVAFWYFEAGVIHAAARLMSGSGERAVYRATVTVTYPLLGSYAVVSVLQGLIDRATGVVGNADALGVVDIGILLWFVVLAAIAAREVYGMPGINALAAAMLPYALLSGLVTLLVVVISGLHAAGAL